MFSSPHEALAAREHAFRLLQAGMLTHHQFQTVANAAEQHLAHHIHGRMNPMWRFVGGGPPRTK
jgi:hypothetical protein